MSFSYEICYVKFIEGGHMRKNLLALLLILLVVSGCTANGNSENDVVYSTIEETEEVSDQTLTLSTFTAEVQQDIDQLMVDYNLGEDQVAYFFYWPSEDIYVHVNDDITFRGASTIKLPAAMYMYDLVRVGEISLDDTLVYCDSCFEANGSIGDNYSVGDQIPLREILTAMIVESDNTSVNILVNYLGGYSAYRHAILDTYSDLEHEAYYYNDNYTNTAYSFQVLNYLYEHSGDYPELISNLKQTLQTSYLASIDTEVPIAHKYGWYLEYLHDYGIVYTSSPYLIGIYTSNVNYGEAFIHDFHEIIYRFVQEHTE